MGNKRKKVNEMQTLIPTEESTSLTYTFRLTKPSYAEAQQICRRAGITLYKEYLAFQKNNPELKLPSYPSQSYKEWTSIYDFLGTVPRNAREWALYERSLKIKSGELVVEPKKKQPKIKVAQQKTEQKPVNQVEDVQDRVLTMLNSGADFRGLFVKMIKHYNVFEECKGAVRTLYTFDELLEKL